MGRLERERMAGMGDRLVGAAREPAHLAEIDAKKRHPGRELDRAAHPIDRLAGLARLVGDETQEVEGVGVVGLRREDLAALRFGFHQLAGGALALGERERIGRYARRRRAPPGGASTRRWAARHAVSPGSRIACRRRRRYQAAATRFGRHSGSSPDGEAVAS
jgi:hypothetical protein